MTPSYEITQSGEKLTIDGVELEFQLTPGTEAPAEMNTWLPQYKALWMAENCTGTLHNLYTLRGAEVRDGAAWASYITEAISLYGKDAEVTFQSHNWPHWGNNVVNDYMVNTAAVYKFINDQTLTYINQVINGLPVAQFASQGQTRTAVISLKLAERALLRQGTGETPVLLLDDVLSELDAGRQDFVLNQLREGQVFITCCETDRLTSLGQVLSIRSGTIGGAQ